MEVEGRGRDRLAADRLAQLLDRQRRPAGLDEEPRQELDRRTVVLVARRDALQERDRLLSLAGARRRLAAPERLAGAFEEVGGLADVAELVEECRRRLELAALLVGGGRPVLEPRSDVDAAGRGPALARLVGRGGLGHHPDRLVELGGPQEVASLHEPRGRLGRAVALEGVLAAQRRRAHRVAGLLEGERRLLVVLALEEQLGGLGVLAELLQHLGRLAVVAAARVDHRRPLELVRLLEGPAGLQRALGIGRALRLREARGEADVLGEVLLVGLRGLEGLAILLPGLRGAQRVAALLVQLGGRSPLAALRVKPRGFEVVALLEEERGGPGGLARLAEERRPLLVVAGRQEELRRPLGAAHLLERGRRRPGLVALEIGLGGLRQPALLLEQLAGAQEVRLLLEPVDLALELLVGPARTQHPRDEVFAADYGRSPDPDALGEVLVADEGGQTYQDPGDD